MSDQIADVLDDAADLLERAGWIQGKTGDPDGARCALGAIAGVTAYPDSSEIFVRSALRIEEAVGGSLALWNDAPERTKQQVLDTFRLAAKQERMRPETPAPPGTPAPRGVGKGLAGDAPMPG
jgi:hypothetical protein